MYIIKGDVAYAVTELSGKWRVSKEVDKLTISVDVPKELCETKDDLREYVTSNDLF